MWQDWSCSDVSPYVSGWETRGKEWLIPPVGCALINGSAPTYSLTVLYSFMKSRCLSNQHKPAAVSLMQSTQQTLISHELNSQIKASSWWRQILKWKFFKWEENWHWVTLLEMTRIMLTILLNVSLLSFVLTMFIFMPNKNHVNDIS